METLSGDPWATLKALCDQHRPKRIDILTGFLGSGASGALAALGVKARIIVGLPRADATVSSSLIDELTRLTEAHQVRWIPALHAKLYVLPGHAAMIGSANFSQPGFSALDELVLATTTPATVAAAQREFDRRWRAAIDIDPDRLVPSAVSEGGSGGTATLGRVASPRAHGFSVPGQPGAHASSGGPPPSLSSATGPQAGPLGVLFVNVGWHPTYDASSLPTGNHRWLNSRAAQTQGSSDEALFVNDGGSHLGPAGRGEVPDFARLDVIFTATDDSGQRRVVAIFRDAKPEPHHSGSAFMMVRAAHDRVTCFPVGRRPAVKVWPGRMSMRRWAVGGPNANHADLWRVYESLRRAHGD